MIKRLDIEKVLHWTFRDELPKGRPVSADIGVMVARGAFVYRPGGISASLGARQADPVDSLGMVPGEPHKDAETVAQAVYQLSKRSRVGSSVVSILGDYLAIGEAVGVTTALKASIFNPQALVISHAIAGTRPRWEFEAPRPAAIRVPYRNAAGALRDRPLVEGFDDSGALVALSPNRGKAATTRGLYDFDATPRSPIAWGNPSPLAIAEARAEYLEWQDALAALATRLAGRLNSIEVTPPAARLLPWITGQDNGPRVLQTLNERRDYPVAPVQPKRRAPGRPIVSDIESKSRPRAKVLKEARASLRAHRAQSAV